jgi:hypothetical protein
VERVLVAEDRLVHAHERWQLEQDHDDIDR